MAEKNKRTMPLELMQRELEYYAQLMRRRMHRVVVVSGGMDSVTLAHLVRQETPEASIHVVSFNYGQRHAKELQYAEACATTIKASGFHIIDLQGITGLLASSHSVLVDHTKEVPEGHYAAESMKATVVPNRNAIMLSIATGVAVAESAVDVAIGVHSGDHFIYPDCRPAFIHEMNIAMRYANDGFANPDFRIYAPFLGTSKLEIAQIGGELGVDYTQTWSCYKGGELHCGKCGTCVERVEALEGALGTDPTEYE